MTTDPHHTPPLRDGHATDGLPRDALQDGEHAIGTSVGAAGGAATGAAIGLVGGPVGAAVGAVVGAVVGGLAGKGIAAVINPAEEDRYWQTAHSQQPYQRPGTTYDDYSPAYRAGYTSRAEGHATWNDARTDWERRWDAEHAHSRLHWPDAEPAVRAAWERANQQYVQSNQG